MNTRAWHDAIWDDAYRRASGDATPIVLASSWPHGGPVIDVSWGKYKGTLCWHGFTTLTTPMTIVAEPFRIDAIRKITKEQP